MNEEVRPEQNAEEQTTATPEQVVNEKPEQAIPVEGELLDETDDILNETAVEVEDVAALREALAEAQQKAEDHWNEMMRVRAEMDNLRKRSARDVENAHKYGLEKLINELLPIKDSLVLGIQAAETATEIQSLREGMELTFKMFQSALEKLGVSEVDPSGEKFNPELHQAMSMVESDEAEPGTVLNVMQKGYTLNDRLLRPAMVIVAKKKTEASA